ncbi:hypothetical protein AXA44_29670 [Rhodococcus sp. SC4]|nr:hypothetical protein AXA44_29670 [Rhodococcus sp. SC4]
MRKNNNTRLLTRDVRFDASTSSSGDGRTLEGYASMFDQDTEIDSWEGTFVERVARGAFKKTLREHRPVLQFDHGRDHRTGTVPIGRFEVLKEDQAGLFVRARLFANDAVEPVREAIAERAIDGMSFTFSVVRDEWTDRAGKPVSTDELWRLLGSPGDRGPLKRTLREVKLYECGPVVFPAYEGTSVGVRTTSPQVRTLSHATATRRLTLLTTSMGFDDHDAR